MRIRPWVAVVMVAYVIMFTGACMLVTFIVMCIAVAARSWSLLVFAGGILALQVWMYASIMRASS